MAAPQSRRGPVPSGTVTFLFSDIEGSTQRWERNRAAMQDAVRTHDAIMRAEIAKHGGYVFKTVGDAFCAAFRAAPDALASSLGCQRAITSENFSAVEGLRIRIALHTGHTDERDGDYFGPALNRVARLMSIGHGGQVLLSDATRALVQDDLPTDAKVMDLGWQRLKDLTQPEHVWQLNVSDSPADFPPLKSLDALPNNLPIQATSFVGRERDVAQVKNLIERHSLLSLLGTGGIGKTRLALQVGSELIDQFADGVWFADFAPISDRELVASVLAKTLGISQAEGRRVDESIAPWLKRKKLLLILDNCEHVLDQVASIVDMILKTAKDVKTLTTSRQALGINGEVLHRLSSLSMSDDVEGLGATQALQYGAIALFVDRAMAADTRFTLTDGTAPIAADICRRLDGIPLAIELAAARVRVLSISSLAQRLDERFKLLTGGSRTALPRQKTLGALIDWSYDLLGASEQMLFNRVGIFAGGFTLDMAAEVCTGDCIDEVEVLDLLTSLTDKSLIVADTAGKNARYRLLESMRAYALDRLAVKGERETLSLRHAKAFTERALKAERRYGIESPSLWLSSLEPETDNFRAVLEWTLIAKNDIGLGGALAGALRTLWQNSGLEGEGRWWIQTALKEVSESDQPAIAGRLWLGLGTLMSGKRAHEAANRARTLCQRVGDRLGVVRSLYEASFASYQMGQLSEASELIYEALEGAHDDGATVLIANCLDLQALIALARGDADAAREGFARALEIDKKSGNESGVAGALGNLAELSFREGDAHQALLYVSEALAIDQLANNAGHLASGHMNSAAYYIALGDLERARVSAHQGLRTARKGHMAMLAAISIQHLALITALGGHMADAARLVGYVDATYQEVGLRREFTEEWGYQKLMIALREQLSEADVYKFSAEGARWSEDEATEEAVKI
ncbi:MAG: hypothetical protein M3160_00060 [Candidatus Eremiobacteraeota bacterium]|nr:hypothetical protein [Candidatus Eremiobacteraeota bacterium]